MDPQERFDESEIRAAEHRLVTALEATSMRPLTEVSIRPLRTEGCGGLATVWVEGSWVSGSGESDSTTVKVRGMILWRRDVDGVWRVAMEHIG